MKRITLILVLILFLGVIGISGCISSDDTTNNNYSNTTAQSTSTQAPANEYTLGNSKFQIPEGWRKIDDSQYDGEKLIGFAIGESEGIILKVRLYKDANEQSSDYNEFLESGPGYTVTTSKKTIKGIQTKVVKTVYDDSISNYQTIKDYYFQKNGKYYRITFDDLRTSKDQSVIDEALNTVISTLN